MVSPNIFGGRTIVLTRINEHGFVNGEIYISHDIHRVIDRLREMITHTYAHDDETRESLIHEVDTPESRTYIINKLRENEYFSISGPLEDNYEITILREQDVNRNNNTEDPVGINYLENQNVFGGKRKIRKTRKAKKSKKSKKSKKTRRH